MENEAENVFIGQKMYDFCRELFPICRSITGEGVRETLGIINEELRKLGIELEIYEVPSGAEVFDWIVPREWRIADAFVEDEDGKHIIDFKNNNLHVIGYSTSVDKWVTYDELIQHVYTQADQPDVIPYVTSYYKEQFGFCMSENQKLSLGQNKKYHMYINSRLFDGVLNYAELFIPGRSDKEVFFSTYFCHPSMANNECSGLVLATELIKYVYQLNNRRYSYRFVLIPETIGSITYLSQKGHLGHLQKKMVAGFNLSCVGDNNDYSIVETISADTLSDRVLKNVLEYHTNGNYSEYSFLERGSDERQYNAPGVDLPVACFCRSKFGEYKEYHTSDDNMDYVSPEGFQGSYDVMTTVIITLEYNKYYKANVLGEPQLGRRGLYPTISKKGTYDTVIPLRNFIAYANGKRDLVAISDKIGISTKELIPIVKMLLENRLIDTEV